jgi:acyl-CoA-binding protein
MLAIARENRGWKIMADLKKQFEAAAADTKKFTKRPADADMLRMYALYKQATVGDAPAKAPSAFDLKGRAKHDAWAKLKGTDTDKAMKSYVDLVGRLKKVS